jgi:hypothetical protein
VLLLKKGVAGRVHLEKPPQALQVPLRNRKLLQRGIVQGDLAGDVSLPLPLEGGLVGRLDLLPHLVDLGLEGLHSRIALHVPREKPPFLPP